MVMTVHTPRLLHDVYAYKWSNSIREILHDYYGMVIVYLWILFISSGMQKEHQMFVSKAKYLPHIVMNFTLLI